MTTEEKRHTEHAITKYLWERIHAADETQCRIWARGIVALTDGDECST